MNEDARNFIKQLKERKINLLDFIILCDFHKDLNLETKRELREEAYKRRLNKTS